MANIKFLICLAILIFPTNDSIVVALNSCYFGTIYDGTGATYIGKCEQNQIYCIKISGYYQNKKYVFLSCTSNYIEGYNDGATFSICQTNNCNYDNSLYQPYKYNGKTVESCYVGGSFSYSDSSSLSYYQTSCPSSSNSYCMKFESSTLNQALKRCATDCVPGSLTDRIRIPSTNFYLSQTKISCCQSNNCDPTTTATLGITSCYFGTIFDGKGAIYIGSCQKDYCIKITGLYQGKKYVFLSCTSNAIEGYYDGATFSICQTNNCNYDDSLSRTSNAKRVSSCNVGGSFLYSDEATSNYGLSSCPSSSNSYCMKFESSTVQPIKRCATACVPGSLSDKIRIPSTEFYLSQTQISCCQDDNCNGANNFEFSMFLILSAFLIFLINY